MVTADAKLVVRAPVDTPIDYIKSLVQKKKEWITEKQQDIARRNASYTAKQFVNGESFLYLGDSYMLEVSGRERQVDLKDGRLVLPEKELSKAREKIIRWYKDEALRIIRERVVYYSQMTGIKYKSVGISNARRRWGSCGPKGSLNFAWRLVMAPLRAIDYAVVHELAHIGFANHSKEYWTRVRTIMPDYEK